MYVQNYYFMFHNYSGGLIIVHPPLCHLYENECMEALLLALPDQQAVLVASHGKTDQRVFCQNLRKAFSASVTSLVVRVREWKYGF